MPLPFLRALFLVCAGALIGPAALAQSRLTAGQLQPDARLLRSALEQLHPGLYRHVDSAMVTRRFAQLEARWSQPHSLPDAYRELTLLLASLRDAHTYANPLNQARNVRALFEQPNCLPLHFRLVGKRMLVRAAAPPADTSLLPRHAEVLRIDGLPVETILDTLLPATLGDGANDANRLHRLQLDGSGRIAPFDILYPLFFKVGPSFALEVRTSDNAAPRVVNVPAITAAAREAALQNRPGASVSHEWRLDFPDAQTARLTLPDFITSREPRFDWKKWLAESFATIQQKKIDAVILDLRACEGGDDAVVPELLRYLSAKPITRVPERKLWRASHVDPGLLPFLDATNPDLKKLNPADFVATPDGFFERRTDRARTVILQPYPQAFTGGRRKVYALCGPRNASAAFQLLRELQANRLAVLVGQPTGGNRRGTTGGQFFLLRLPNTGLEVDIPLIAYTPLRAQPDEGLEPDELIEPTIEATRAGTDLEMARVSALLREERMER